MNRSALSVSLLAVVAALGLTPRPASAVSPWLVGDCLSAGNGGTANSCSIETRYLDVNNVVQDLCTDGIDNDGNGLIDANDPHCNAEVLCQDGYDNDADGLIDEAQQLNSAGTNASATDCACVRLAARLPGGNACTANDMTVSYSAEPEIFDGCINSSDTLDAQLYATITVKPERYDLSMWINPLGTDALDGALCARQVMIPVSATPDPTNPLGTGPFQDIDGDACGDRSANLTAIYKFPFRINAPCTDLILNASGQAGFVDLGQCGAWQQPGGNPVCSNISGAVPGTSSKCNCSRGDTGVPGPNVRKTCTDFENPAGLDSLIANGELDQGETATFTIAYSNTVANCAPGDPVGPDVFGRNRCGTASFVRVVIAYGAADDNGDFYISNDGINNIAIPACPSTVAVDNDPGVGTNFGVICNDTNPLSDTYQHLIFAPSDPNQSYSYGVLSAFTGSRTLPIRYTKTTNSTAAISLTSRLWWDDDLDAPDPGGDGTITAAEAVDLDGAIEQTCSNCTCSTTVQATPITLASFAVTPAGRGARFVWSTETEVGNVGFNFYALVGGEKVKLNDEPIPAASIDSLEPQSYEAYFDVPDGAESFFIEDLDLTGKARSHGPFATGKKYGEKIRPEPIDWASVRREHGLKGEGDARQVGRGRGNGSFRSTAQARAPKGGGGGSTAPSTIELLVDRDGLYRVTHAQLLAAGFDLSSQAGSGLALRAAGKAVPIYVSTTGKFGPGSFFEFWGEALDTLYTATNVYRLDVGQKKPARVAVSTEAPAGTAEAAYLETRRFERDRGYAFWSPGGDPFFDTEMLVFSTAKSFSFPFSIDGFVPGAGTATLRAEIFGGSTWKGIDPDHHVQFRLNGTLVGEAKFDGMTGVAFEADIPDGLLVDGANTLVLRLPSVPGTQYDLVSLDAFEVRYPRLFTAESGGLDFTASGGRFDVGGLTSGAVIGYRRDGSAVTRLNGLTVTPDGGGYRASLPGAASPSRHAVAGDNALLAPTAIQAALPLADLKSGPASYLVVSHAAFLDGLSPLVAARAAQGHSVKVVDVEDVYAQFSHGIYDAAAIRDYIAFAYSTLGTRYVLLVGGDTYDYRDFLGLAPVSFVPSLYRETSETVRFAPSDATYADVDGDGLQDLAIGRLPVRTLEELDNAITKTLQYDARSYLDTAVLAADYTDAGANESFTTASNRLAEDLPPSWQVDRIYLDQTPLATARTELFAGIAAGSGLTSYVGHSGPTSWGSSVKPVSSHLFKIADVSLLTNSGLPTVVTQLGCWNTYYASPRTESLGPRLLLVADKGAAAVLGAATLTQDANGNRFGSLLTPRLVAPGATLGDAIWQAKRDLAAQSPESADLRDILYGWILLGDPALKVVP
jgi:hypothetical protein